MINWTRAFARAFTPAFAPVFGCALLLGLSACAQDSSTSSDGGYGGDAGTCLEQSECACTCICADGLHRVTYATCVDGYCSDCAYFCSAVCG